MLDNILINKVSTARLLGIFKTICLENKNLIDQQKLRNILYRSKDRVFTIKEIVRRNQKIELTDAEYERLLELIEAFLNKKTYRKPIDINLKRNLLVKQNCKCAICSKNIDINSHADHIIPFKYVGDCLVNNWQLLCEHCNEAKNSSLDYEIKYLLKL